MSNKSSNHPVEEFSCLVDTALSYWIGKVRAVLLDDLRQEGMLVLWEKWKEWDGGAEAVFRRQVTVSIRNKMSDYLRQQGGDLSVQRRPARWDEDPGRELANGSFRPQMIPFSEDSHSSQESYDPLESICFEEKIDYITSHLSAVELSVLKDKAYGIPLQETADRLGFKTFAGVSFLRQKAIKKCKALARRWELICEATV